VNSSTPSRPTWDETWLTVARAVAQRSLCTRDKVGAVVVSKSNRLLETGYNGPPGGFETEDKPCTQWCLRAANNSFVEKDYSDCPSLHAEANALMRGDRIAREGGTIYITSHVCMGCAKLIANSGLELIVVSTTWTPAHRNADASYRFLESCGLTVVTG
jgi:dCMP deaminase